MQLVAEKIDTPDGPMTRKEAAAFYGISLNTLIRRIWERRAPEQWFVSEIPHPGRKRKYKPTPLVKWKSKPLVYQTVTEQRQVLLKGDYRRGHLNWTQREVLDVYMMYYVGGKSIEEVSNWLLRSPSAIRNQIARQGWSARRDRSHL